MARRHHSATIDAQKTFNEINTILTAQMAYDEDGVAHPILITGDINRPMVKFGDAPLPKFVRVGPGTAQAIDPEIRDLRNDINDLLRQIEDKNQLTIIKGIISQFVNKEGANIG